MSDETVKVIEEVEVETEEVEVETEEVEATSDEIQEEIEAQEAAADSEAHIDDASSDDEISEGSEEPVLEAQEDDAEDVEVAAEPESIVYDVTDPTAPWLLSCVEALVFASTQPLTTSRVVEVLKGEKVRIEKDIVRGAFKHLVETWNDPERRLATGFQLVEVAKGLSFRTVMDNAPFIRRFFAERPQRLTRAQLETLAIISYRQPATRGQVEEIRGVDCGSALRTLLDKNLIKVLGKSEEIGRPWIYGTTKYFLSFFALKSLHDLPPLQEVQELDAENTEKLKSILGDTAEENMIMELFDPEKQGTIISQDTEEMSEAALTDLESAVGFANEVNKRIQDGPSKKEASEESAGEAKSLPEEEPKPPVEVSA